jgi:hypothetical protein
MGAGVREVVSMGLADMKGAKRVAREREGSSAPGEQKTGQKSRKRIAAERVEAIRKCEQGGERGWSQGKRAV